MIFDREYEVPDITVRDFHAVSTITLGELVDMGFVDWSDPVWSWDWYDEDQRDRMQKMIVERFWGREICIVPPILWRMQFIRKLNELMRKASLLYKLRESLEDRPTLDVDEYHKARDIYSDFPATLLNGSSGDYASTGTDREYETVRDRGALDAYMSMADFVDPDIYVLDGLEVMFSFLVSVDVDGF